MGPVSVWGGDTGVDPDTDRCEDCGHRRTPGCACSCCDFDDDLDMDWSQLQPHRAGEDRNVPDSELIAAQTGDDFDE
jgi:hypothetical protein